MFPLPPVTVTSQAEYDRIMGRFGGESGWAQWLAMVTAAEVRRRSVVEVDERLRAQRDDEVAALVPLSLTPVVDVSAVEFQTPVRADEV